MTGVYLDLMRKRSDPAGYTETFPNWVRALHPRVEKRFAPWIQRLADSGESPGVEAGFVTLFGVAHGMGAETGDIDVWPKVIELMRERQFEGISETSDNPEILIGQLPRAEPNRLNQSDLGDFRRTLGLLDEIESAFESFTTCSLNDRLAFGLCASWRKIQDRNLIHETATACFCTLDGGQGEAD